ncbi:MAG: 6-carboxytetrahydropterin synthase [Bacteroidetes bacterium CHB5]|nr:6-carboxytetrahydropterin synthase [Bacteroidetes bacterium CHB5]
MIGITKIFRFETAHAIHGYAGACAHIHGHSYELHVCIAGKNSDSGYIKGTGIIFDFKELKALVNEAVISKLDHKLVLSRKYIEANGTPPREALLIFDYEPSAENLLIFIRQQIAKALPGHIQLISLRLWETADSYAEWSGS